MAPPVARVIVHADDFGLHPSLNAGIEQAHREGVVTSASLMPLGAAFEDAVRRCRSLPELDLGLHFTLVGVAGCPPTLSAFLASHMRGLLPAREIAYSLRHQLDAVQSQGLTVTHLDSHQHLHALPGIMRVVCPIAAEYGIQAIRLPTDGPPHSPVPMARKAQAAALKAVARLSSHFIHAAGLSTSDHFSGMAVSGHLQAETLEAYVREAQPGLTEIVCHPGLNNDALRRAFDWGYDWEGETSALVAPEVKQTFKGTDVVLTNWTGRVRKGQ